MVVKAWIIFALWGDIIWAGTGWRESYGPILQSIQSVSGGERSCKSLLISVLLTFKKYLYISKLCHFLVNWIVLIYNLAEKCCSVLTVLSIVSVSSVFKFCGSGLLSNFKVYNPIIIYLDWTAMITFSLFCTLLYYIIFTGLVS